MKTLLRTVLALALLAASPAMPSAPQVDESLSERQSEARARLGDLQSVTDLGDAAKASASEAYTAAIAALERAAADRKEIDRIGSDAANPGALPEVEEAPDPLANIEDLQAAGDALRTDISELETALTGVRDRIARREERRRANPGALSDARSDLSALRSEPLVLDSEVDARVAAARRAEREALVTALEARIDLLIRESETFQTLQAALVERERDLIALLREARERLEGVTTRILADAAFAAQEDFRAARAAVDDAEAALAAAPPDARAAREADLRLARQNVDVAARRLSRIRPVAGAPEDTISQEELVRDRREETEGAEALQRRLEALERRSSKAISNQQIADLLRAERKRLVDERSFDQRLAEIQQRWSQLSLAALDIEEELDGVEREGEDASDARERLLRARAALLRADLDLIDQLLAEYQRLETALGTQRDVTRELRAFVESRVLWVRSASPLWAESLDEFAGAAALLPGPGDVAALPRALRVAVATRPDLCLGLLALAIALFGIRRRLAVGLEGRAGPEAPPEARRRAALSIQPTLEQLLIHAMEAAFLPLLAATLAVPLRDAGSSSALVDALRNGTDGTAIAARFQALGEGIVAVLPAWFALDLARRLARPSGVGELALQWGAANMRTLRAHLRWFLPAFLALAALSGALQALEDQLLVDTFGRILFCAKVGLSGAFLTLVLRPGGLNPTGPRESLLARLRRVWFVLGVGGSLLLTAASLVGYHYTARNLWSPFVETIALLSLILTVRAIVARWILVNRRRLRIEQARDKRERAEAEREVPAERRAIEPELDEALDLGSLEEEMSELLRFATGATAVLAIAAIWASFVPALELFKGLALYSTEAGETRTYWDLGAALLILFATTVLAKRLPGLLEFSVLNRFSLGSGERYAIRAITVYVVVVVGALMGLGQLGVTWGSVQWLAAAVSVGLGFGLQEIFANFVSGLILLFERPMRVGDIVTVGGIEGRVTEIRTRATTILDYDVREHVIPNREFVTGSLVNWTLSDIMTRLVVRVGIAYGSDVELARSLMLQAAGECVGLHKEPKPSVVFREFGESSLDFDLRVYMTDRDYWPEVMDYLHKRVDDLFRANGITIPFPQRDLHMKSAAPEVVKVFGRSAE